MKIFLSGCEPGDGLRGTLYAKPILEKREMKIFLSGCEGGMVGQSASSSQGMKYLIEQEKLKREADEDPQPIFDWNLVSYFYMRKSADWGKIIRDYSKEILVDSGAFSFIGKSDGKGIDFDKYVDEYCEFIRDFDRPNVIGYFEMDIGCIVGYDKVQEYRRKLESVTDKIIPVWHHYLGIPEFVNMCKQSKSRIVAITGCHNEIKDEDYIRFLKTAHQYGCKMHCLGMTNKTILNTVPFDYTDSSSWLMGPVFGRVEGHKQKINQEFARVNRGEVCAYAYLQGMKMQKQYYEKWRKISRD